MSFLENLGFDPNDIIEVEKSTPKRLVDQIVKSEDLVIENVSFLQELGITNYKEVVIKYADMFLMDPSNFKGVFLKYDKEDLVDKIAKNVTIIEHL